MKRERLPHPTSRPGIIVRPELVCLRISETQMVVQRDSSPGWAAIVNHNGREALDCNGKNCILWKHTQCYHKRRVDEELELDRQATEQQSIDEDEALDEMDNVLSTSYADKPLAGSLKPFSLYR